MDKMLVIIPTLNEGKNIGAVVQKLKTELPNADVLVLDGYSEDETVTESISKGAKVVQVSKSFGIGGAVEAGILYAYRNNYDYLLRIDGDGQHDPEDLKKLLDLLINKEADFVIGSRFLGNSEYNPNALRNFGINFISFLISVCYGIVIKDCTSGCHLYNKSLIKFFAVDDNFDYSEVSSICLARKGGFNIKEHFINMRVRQSGQSTFSALIAAIYMIRNSLEIVLTMPRAIKKRK
jgi:glycosyltransferase involved in cell wall biosynthesis